MYAVNDDVRMVPPAACDDEDRIGSAVTEAWLETFGVSGRETPIFEVLVDDHGVEQSRQVHRLLTGIEDRVGVSLPMTIIFQVPTLAGLTEVVRRGTWPPFRRPLLIRPGSGAPLFVFPGLGGLGLDLLPLLRILRWPGPIYLNHPHGIDGTAPPYRNMKDIVLDHMAMMRSVQPHGPYRLLGYSYGGDIALEVARHFGEEGEPIGFLGLIESTVPEAEWSYGVWLGYMYRRWAHHLQQIRQLSAAEAIGYGRKRLVPLFGRVALLFGSTRWWSPFARQDLPAQLQDLWDAEVEASSQYRVNNYGGKVILFASRERHKVLYDPAKVWCRVVRELNLQWLDGENVTHMSILRRPPGLTALAAGISAKLEAAEAAQ